MARALCFTILFACAVLHGFAIGGVATPRKPAPIFTITDYGAVGDAKTLNTKAIQAAVDACAAAGGGQVVVPAGIFISGSIFLKSHVEFHVSPGAVLRGSPNLEDYSLLDQEGHGYHIQGWLYAALLTSYRCDNVSITGTGTVDGYGKVWWEEKNRTSDMEAAFRKDGRMKGIRPPLLYFFDCTRVKVRDVKLINSPMYAILPILCRNLLIDGVTIENPWKPYNNCDGIDIMSCRDVRVTNCYIDTGDDGICLKTVPGWCMLCGPGEKGEGGPDYTKPRIPCENVIIDNCVVRHAHSGVGIWAEVIGGIRNVLVSNCVFDGTRQGIRIARYPWTGGYVKDVRIDSIVMRRVEFAIEVSNYYDPDKIDDRPDRDTTPEFSDIHFSNITATQTRIACLMYGMPKAPVRNINFSNIRIEADKGFDLRNAEDIYLDNVTVTCPGPAFQAKEVRNLELQRFSAPQPQADVPVIQLADVSDAWIHGCTATPGTGTFVGLVGEGNRDIVLEANRLTQAKQAQAPVKPASAWSSSGYGYSGSSMWKMAGECNTFLPVPPAVWETIQREWQQGRVRWGINGVHRMESGAHPDVVLEPDDNRRIYVILADGVNEQLLILEDGTLLRKVQNFNWQLP